MLHIEEIKLLQKSLRIHRKVADLVLCIESDSSVSPVLFQGLEDKLGLLQPGADLRVLTTLQLRNAFAFLPEDGNLAPGIVQHVRRELSKAIANLEKMP